MNPNIHPKFTVRRFRQGWFGASENVSKLQSALVSALPAPQNEVVFSASAHRRNRQKRGRMKFREQTSVRVVAGAASILLSLYCGAVLFYVATSADLGLRCLLTNDQIDQAGVQVRRVSDRWVASSDDDLPASFGPMPEPGDVLTLIGDREIVSFADFTSALSDLRFALGASPAYDSRVEEGTDPRDVDRYQMLPPVIDYYSYRSRKAAEDGDDVESESRNVQHGRYVRVQYQREGEEEPLKAWLRIQTLPALEVLLSIVWCLLEFGIFAVAALALFHRPADRSTRLFFALCFVTLPTFVGGYHWWVIASNLFLVIPFVFCAVLIPVVTLHFFLNYPAEHSLSRRYGMALLPVLYAPAVLMLGALYLLIGTLYAIPVADSLTTYQTLLLVWMRFAVDVYIAVSLGYFAASVACMFVNYRRCQQGVERKQMQWILGAAVLATPLVFYAAYLAYADRVGLALGRGRIPMIVVSLLFLAAYGIGILRYRLMLLDQMVSRHTLYVLMNQAVTLGYSLLIAVVSLLTVLRGMSVPEQLLPLTIMLTVVILAIGWLRDNVQQMLDRRFFREKYRLDRAMQQMNLVVAKVADVRSLADHMLRSCREVLQVRFAALYLRDGRSQNFDLVCAVAGRGLPAQITLDADCEELLEQSGSFQRSFGTVKGRPVRLQDLHRQMNSQLMHGFDVDGQLSGVVVLGVKTSNNPFTAEDTTFVSAIGQMTGVALQCVRVQQNVSRLDGILQEKVRKIEAQDRQIAILRNRLVQQETPTDVTERPAEAEFDVGRIRGSSPALRSVLDSAKKVARSESSVLIRGESGTGKELLATALHKNSPRGGGPLVSVNCAALSPALLESELFGHVKGAFTGAYRDSVGRFQMADQGTLFLDEIGDVSPDVQVKLLRVLQERKFEPVGSRESVSVDVRLIAATHQNLEQLMREGKFREDLYYRLNVITLRLPPLRERKEDIFELALDFLSEAARSCGKQMRDIDDLAVRALLNYNWPGNIRELHNAIHRAVVLAETDCLLLENLPVEVQQAEPLEFAAVPPGRLPADSKAKARSANDDTEKTSVRATVPADDADERLQLSRALDACDGNKAKAARLLGMPRSTFYSKLKKHKLS
ncbi:MAG: sigma-54-dependent Fis family transcriptional regulator [Planctomyces sp.]|nr:sigma-54-dependent Fis family transcriptional regulator [Planctomyces sp.]